jgi:hypothetical protein
LPLLAGAEDFLIDALALHDSMHLLRGLLADPGVVKVRSTLLFASMKHACLPLTAPLPK